MRATRQLGLDESLAAVNAILAEWKTYPSNPPITIAIVDDSGNLVAFARSDGAGPLLGRNCVKKAYTSAMTGASTKVFGERRPGERDYAAELEEHGWNLAEMGDPNLMIISGGICVRDPDGNAILGGIGVSGLSYGPGDHDLALVGLKAMNL
jgi:glc operon protein GlcG